MFRKLRRLWVPTSSARAGRALRTLLDRLVVPTCAFCGSDDDAWPICRPCRLDLPWVRMACPRCARPLATGQHRSIACGRCQRRPPPFTRAYAPLHYMFPVDAAIRALKFRADLPYAPALAELLVPAVRREAACWDALVPVPLHRWRQALRGFNQAREIATWLSRRVGLPVVELAQRHRRTSPQSTLPARRRRANVCGAFRVRATRPPERILLIDDVMTTGETCGELARVLYSAGVSKIGVACVARATPGSAQAGRAGSNV